MADKTSIMNREFYIWRTRYLNQLHVCVFGGGGGGSFILKNVTKENVNRMLDYCTHMSFYLKL